MHAASLAAPYRHARLSAVKHLEQPDSIDGISANATPEEFWDGLVKDTRIVRNAGEERLDALARGSGIDWRRRVDGGCGRSARGY